MIESFLKKLSEELSLPPPKVEGKELISFSLNDSIKLNLRDLKPGLSMEAFLLPCPQILREELFSYLMEANLLGHGTGGARIALDSEEKNLTLLIGLPYELNYQLFRETFEDFVNHLIFWRNEIEKFKNKKTFY